MNLKNNSRYFELIGAILCAIFLAYLQWLMNRESDQPTETRTLIKYLFLDLSCFLIAFLIVERFLIASFRRILSSLMIAIVGGIASAIVIDLPHIFHNWAWRDITEGRFRMPIQSSIIILLWASVITLPIMLFIYSIGFAVRLIQKQMMKTELK